MKNTKRKIPSMPEMDMSTLDTYSITEAERMVDERYYFHKKQLTDWWNDLSEKEKKIVEKRGDKPFHLR